MNYIYRTVHLVISVWSNINTEYRLTAALCQYLLIEPEYIEVTSPISIVVTSNTWLRGGKRPTKCSCLWCMSKHFDFPLSSLKWFKAMAGKGSPNMLQKIFTDQPWIGTRAQCDGIIITSFLFPKSFQLESTSQSTCLQ